MGRRGKTAPRRKTTNGAKAPWEPSAIQLEIYAKVCEGTKTFREIGAAYGVGHPTVSHVVKRVEEWLAPRIADSVREIKTRHTQSLLHVFGEAMRAWERSKMPAITVVLEPGLVLSDGTIGPQRRKRTIKFQAGNPAYLSEARAALSEIREIWGANAPVKVEHSGELRVAGQTVEEAREQLARRLDEARARMMAPSEN